MSRDRSVCLYCGEPLLPNQTKFCSQACRKAQKEKNRIRENKRNGAVFGEDRPAEKKGKK